MAMTLSVVSRRRASAQGGRPAWAAGSPGFAFAANGQSPKKDRPCCGDAVLLAASRSIVLKSTTFGRSVAEAGGLEYRSESMAVEGSALGSVCCGGERACVGGVCCGGERSVCCGRRSCQRRSTPPAEKKAPEGSQQQTTTTRRLTTIPPRGLVAAGSSPPRFWRRQPRKQSPPLPPDPLIYPRYSGPPSAPGRGRLQYPAGVRLCIPLPPRTAVQTQIEPQVGNTNGVSPERGIRIWQQGSPAGGDMGADCTSPCLPGGVLLALVCEGVVPYWHWWFYHYSTIATRSGTALSLPPVPAPPRFYL